MTFLYPMRPGLTVPDTEAGREMLPKDWLYQVKLDDERAMVHASGVYTRFGKPFDKVKLAKFTDAFLELNRCLRNSVDLDNCWLDVALIGFRKTRPPYQVVLLDIPTALGSYQWRKLLWRDLPFFRDDGDFLASHLSRSLTPLPHCRRQRQWETNAKASSAATQTRRTNLETRTTCSK